MHGAKLGWTKNATQSKYCIGQLTLNTSQHTIRPACCAGLSNCTKLARAGWCAWRPDPEQRAKNKTVFGVAKVSKLSTAITSSAWETRFIFLFGAKWDATARSASRMRRWKFNDLWVLQLMHMSTQGLGNLNRPGIVLPLVRCEALLLKSFTSDSNVQPAWQRRSFNAETLIGNLLSSRVLWYSGIVAQACSSNGFSNAWHPTAGGKGTGTSCNPAASCCKVVWIWSSKPNTNRWSASMSLSTDTGAPSSSACCSACCFDCRASTLVRFLFLGWSRERQCFQ